MPRLSHTKSSRLTPRHSRPRRRWILSAKIAAVLATVALLSWGIIELVRLPQVRVQEVKVSGTHVLTEEELQQASATRLGGAYAGVVTRDSIFFAPTRTIERDLAAEFARIKEIDVRLRRGNVLAISLSEYQSDLLWCGEQPAGDLASSTPQRMNDCYFMTENGYLFAQAPGFTEGVHMVYYGPVERRDEHTPIRGSYAPEHFPELRAFVNRLERLGYEPEILTFENEEDHAVYVESGARIRFDRDTPLRNVAHTLDTVVQQEEELDRSLTGIEYVDTRFEGKVLYK